VVVTLDTFRADRLGADPHSPEGFPSLTPNLDALAARGVRFDDAITASISTPPSHATIFTGLMPTAHGLRRLWGQALDPGQVTLAERLADHGFERAAFVSGLPLMRAAGLAQGFETYDDAFAVAGRERSARETNALVREWLAGRSDDRLFLWVHYFDPHMPYLAPREIQQRIAGRTAEGAEMLHAPVPAGTAIPATPPDPESARWMQGLYDAEVVETDAAFGTLMELLDEAGILDDAVVAVVADHGESLGEHGAWFGHWDVYDEVARVPMLLADPEGRHLGVVTSTVRTADLVPTLLAWLGLPVPAGLDGRDLTPLVVGDERSDRIALTEQLDVYPVHGVYQGGWLLRHRPGAAGGRSLLTPRPGATGAESERAAQQLGVALARALAASAEARPTARPVSEGVAEGLRALGYSE
jgi:arylsulfatase A-like enzyme